MKILIITNPKVAEYVDDVAIAEAFRADGHLVDLVNKFYPESLEEQYDIFLKRNSWSEDEEDFVLGQDDDEFKRRIVKKNLPRINFDGKFDGHGKKYLCDLFKKGMGVIPSVENYSQIHLLPESEFYLLKPTNGWDGFGIQKVKKQEIAQKWNENFIIQPKMEFVAEVQFYFVGNQFEYALAFVPSKWPDYPKPIEYHFSAKEKKLAHEFANLSPNYNGVQRIDFLKLKNGELRLLEIEDSSPNLNLKDVSLKLQRRFIDDYKKMVYEYMEKRAEK